VAEIGRGQVDAFYLHLAEGQADNQRSQNEFGRLVQDYQGLTPATVLIHGTALTTSSSARSKTPAPTWSGPRKATCGCTADHPAADALQLGIPVGLGADWLPAAAPACSPS
jgi:5-methylthioadenosine/S-adenosylhomocysteine deaminase